MKRKDIICEETIYERVMEDKRNHMPTGDENSLRRLIINNLIANPILGENYIDYHTDDGRCGLTIKIGEYLYNIIIEKVREEE